MIINSNKHYVSLNSRAFLFFYSTIFELERRKILKESQLLSLISLDDNLIFLKDGRPKRHDRLIEVQLKNKKLFCLSDNSEECIHVGFAHAFPEVIKALE